MAELTIADFTFSAKSGGEVLQFGFWNGELEEFKTAAEPLDCHSPTS
jgi:hypothetical protein